MIKVMTIREAAEIEHDLAQAFPSALAATVSVPLEDELQDQHFVSFPGALVSLWFANGEDAARDHGCASLAELACQPSPPRLLAWENVIVTPPVERPAGAVKLIAYIRRKDGMTAADFSAYWRDNHAPLVPRTPRLRGYVQSHAVPEYYAAGEHPAFEGTAELWFDSVDDFFVGWTSPELLEEQHPDTANFLVGGPYVCLTRETVRFDRRS